MTLEPEQGISRELSLGEIISKTFDLYRRDFAKYFVIFAVVGVIVQILTTLTRQAFALPVLPPNPTPQQVNTWFSGIFTALFLFIGAIFVLSVVFSPIAQGSAIKMASEQITKGQVNLGLSVRYVLSRLLSIWAVNILVGIIVFFGIFALIVPGIILAIMFSLAFPVLLIENKGVFDSMGRSRVLVSHRWGKTFATFLAVGIIVLIASLVVMAVSTPLGVAAPVVNGILSALYQPLFPILLAVYYYSSLARTAAPVQPGFLSTPATPIAPAGMKFCTSCGTQQPSSAAFCNKCGSTLL